MQNQTGNSWGLSVEHYDEQILIHTILPDDDDELQWELAHALHETNVLVDPEDYTSQMGAVLNEKDWSSLPAIGDTNMLMRPYVQMIDELFDLEDIDYTENVQARYFDQLAWMYLFTYAHLHLSYTRKNEKDD